MSAIEIEGLTKYFGSKLVLDRVKLQLDGGVCGLLGANGAGKTTLMRCLLGLLRVHAGSVTYQGKRLNAGQPLPGVGYLPQRFDVYRDLRVRDSLRYFANLKKIARVSREREIDRCLELVNLSDVGPSYGRTLSGGMVRRLGIAQALLGDPAVLFLDEPTAGLDPEERIRFKVMIQRIAQTRIILLSTHILDDIEGLCHTVAILERGRILTHQKTEEIARHAAGQIWFLPVGAAAEVVDYGIVLRHEADQSSTRLRVWSDQAAQMRRLNGRPCPPELEDGYMALIQSARHHA